MVASGQSTIRPLEFSSSIHPDLPVEVIDRSELIRRLGPEYFSIPSRPLFHALQLVHSGQGAHTVDFELAPLRPGRLVQIRPGQVQTWDLECDCGVSLVLSRPASLPLAVEFTARSAYRDLDQDSLATANMLVDALRREQDRFTGDEASKRLMNSLFEALCGIFNRASAEQTGPLPDAYVAFRESIERDLSVSHTVRQHVNRLGYSERTISRACQRVTGQSARVVLNARLVLEAKRLLAHTDKPAATISEELGFSEATNFQKFFVRHTGQRPSQFREIHRKRS